MYSKAEQNILLLQQRARACFERDLYTCGGSSFAAFCLTSPKTELQYYAGIEEWYEKEQIND